MYGKGARLISLLAASALALLILIYPIALAHPGSMPSHGSLTLMMLGICAGFVHGVGFTPESALLRWLLHPILAWLMMGMGLILLA